jgi:hypothetical protein
VALLPIDGNELARSRVFSLVDGKHMMDSKIATCPSSKRIQIFANLTVKLIAVTACYDYKQNLIWIFDDFKVECWKNLGMAPKHSFELSTNYEEYPSFTPEAILSRVLLNEYLFI